LARRGCQLDRGQRPPITGGLERRETDSLEGLHRPGESLTCILLGLMRLDSTDEEAVLDRARAETTHHTEHAEDLLMDSALSNRAQFRAADLHQAGMIRGVLERAGDPEDPAEGA